MVGRLSVQIAVQHVWSVFSFLQCKLSIIVSMPMILVIAGANLHAMNCIISSVCITTYCIYSRGMLGINAFEREVPYSNIEQHTYKMFFVGVRFRISFTEFQLYSASCIDKCSSSENRSK